MCNTCCSLSFRPFHQTLRPQEARVTAQGIPLTHHLLHSISLTQARVAVLPARYTQKRVWHETEKQLKTVFCDTRGMYGLYFCIHTNIGDIL